VPSLLRGGSPRGSDGVSPLASLRPERRLAGIVILYLVLIAGIVGYNARGIARERGSALIVNVAARQRALAERYVKDAILVTEGVQADPGDDATQLLSNAEALLLGGEVIAVQGADSTVRIPPASDDPRVIAKLNAERQLIEEMIASGERLLRMSPTYPGFAAQLLELRVAGAQMASISNDAVGQMTANTEAAFAHLVTVSIALGIFGAALAIAMGLLLRRVGVQRSAQFRSLVHNASDLITVVDDHGGIRYQSPSVSKLVGIDADMLLGTDYLRVVDPEDRSHLDAVFAGLVGSPGGTTTTEYHVRHADGSSRFVESIVSNLLDDSTVQGLVLNTRDVTDRKNLEQELAHQAFHDSLTGLSNRSVFRDRLDHALGLSIRHERSLAVLLLDLDGFKTVNDSLGHDVGDELLVAGGARIEGCARSSDTVARLGGDEFVVLLEEDVDEPRARSAAARMLASLAAPFGVSDREVFIGASVGIAVSHGGSVDADALIRNADTAMYAAKAAGRVPVALPADRRLRHRRRRRGGGVDPLDASESRAPRSGRLHRRRGGDRLDRADGDVGAGRGMPANGEVAKGTSLRFGALGECQPVNATAPGTRSRGPRARGARGERAGALRVGAGDHGGQPAARGR
jgi:diguanylate cyclase (GGDEF)-like protein/PAS domain S-box-containing protein